MSADLFAAIERHDLDRLAALLAAGADPNARLAAWPGWLPLEAAIEELEQGGSTEALILLLRHGAQVDGGGDAEADDSTPLLMALFRGQLEAARLLLAAGADPNRVGDEGYTPLRWSVEQDDLATAALLLRCGGVQNIDRIGSLAGTTALGVAASRLNLPMVELLLAGGADPDALDADYKAARDHLPLRDGSDPRTWDAVAALVGAAASPGS